MRIIAMRMGERPVVEEMELKLKVMQEFVGGLVERIVLEDGIDLWFNEEGLFTCGPNRHVKWEDHNLVINGPMFITAFHGPDTTGLTEEQIAKWLPVTQSWPRALSSMKEGDIGEPGELLLIQ